MSLTAKRCKPCEGKVAPLQAAEAQELLQQTPAWQMREDSKQISRTFKFKNYYETMAFVNAVAWIAHQEDHHPDLEVGYNRCHIQFSTHAINGLSENDFICAAKVDNLLLPPTDQACEI